MARIAGFLFGLLIGLAVFGVAALLFIPRDKRIDSTKLEVPSIAKIGLNGDAFTGKAVPEVVFEGNVEVTTPVAAALRNAKEVTLTLDIIQVMPKGGRKSIGRFNAENPKFPLRYSLPWVRPAVVGRIDWKDLGVYNVEVVICTNQNPGQCFPVRVPRYEGMSQAAPKLNGTIATQPIGSVIKLDAGTTVVNLHRDKPDLADCVNSGFTISGTIKPTPAFLAKAGNNPRIAVLMHPAKNVGIVEPFAGPLISTLRPVTRADMAGAAASGISFTNVTLAGLAGAAFTLKMPEGGELLQPSFVAVLCKAAEADIDCAARFYPAVRGYALSYGEAGIFRLAPKDFHMPVCGEKSVFYLNDWKLPPGSAGLDAYLKANPPEVVDGAAF